MQFSSIIEALKLVPAPGLPVDMDVLGAYTSDLLSDVMGFARDGDVLITIQAHKNTIAVASLVGCPAVIVCNNRPLPEDMVDAAAKEGIGIAVSPETQFVISGRLFRLLGLE